MKVEHLEKQSRTTAEKTLVMDTQLQHFGEAIEEIAKQVESANRFTANRLYNQDLKISQQSNGISGALMPHGHSASQDNPALGKLSTLPG